MVHWPNSTKLSLQTYFAIYFGERVGSEAIEEEYQECLKRKLEKEAEFQDTKSEMDGLFIKVERYLARLEQLTQREAEASEIVATFPAKVSELEKKIHSAEALFTPSSNF